MKQHYVIYSLFSLILFNYSCKKNAHELDNSTPSLIHSAEQYFNTEVLSKNPVGISPDVNSLSNNKSPRQQGLKKPLWDLAYIAHLKFGTGVVVPVAYNNSLVISTNLAKSEYYNVNTLTKLFIYQDASKLYHAELITAFPDSSYSPKIGEDFKGLLFVDDWWGNPINKYKIEKDKTVKIFNKNGLPTAANQELGKTQKSEDFYVCYEIYGYNYSVGEDTIQWSEPAGCSYLYGGTSTNPDDFNNPQVTPSGGDYGNLATAKDSGLTVPIIPLNIALYNGDKNIKNIKDYIKCFTNVAGSDYSYSVRLCVDQPEPDNDMAWGWSLTLNNPVSIGHTFLILSESGANATISRSVGFYPIDFVKPGFEARQGVLNNDEIHDYDVSLSITLDNGQFFNLLNYISQGNDPGYLYNLNSNNCTTFALNALSSIGISSIPRTEGTWLGGGKGLNPGNLGEDIRIMPLASNMTRTSISGSHLNQGTCN